MYKFKVGDKGKTRRGESYRIICTDRLHDSYPMIVLVGKNNERVEHYTSTGSYVERHPSSDNDLLPPTVTKWLNVWIRNGVIYSNLHATEAQAKQGLTSDLFNYIINAQPVEVPAD